MACRVSLLLVCLLPLLGSVQGEQGGEVQGLQGGLLEQGVAREVVRREAQPGKKKKKEKKARKGKKKKKNPNKKRGSKKCPNGKKGQECRRNKKKNNSRKKLERKNQGRRKQGARSQGSGRQITGNATSCVMKLVKYARLNDKKASAVVKQVKRIQGNDKIQGSKGNKKGDFNATRDRLIAALGGDPNNPKCDGTPIGSSNSSGNATFRNAANAKQTLEELDACSSDIKEKCSKAVTGNATLAAELQACYDVAQSFKDAFGSCTEPTKSIDDACKCVEAISETNVTIMQKCNTATVNSEALALKKACKNAVGKCKTAEAKAVEGIDSCKERNKCGGAKDKAEAEKQLKVLNPLKKALERKEFANALKTAGLDTGTGSDGTTGRFAPTRRTREEDGDGCKALDTQWASFNTSATKAAESKDSDLDEDAASETTTTLNAINDKTTLVADLQSCKKETRTLEDGRTITISLTIVKIRVAVFWCLFWQVKVIEVKITILTLTFGAGGSNSGTTAAVGTVAPTSPAITTAAPSGRKLMLSNLMKRAAIGPVGVF